MGYDTGFLSDQVPPPTAGSATVLDYTHFTVAMNIDRALAWWVAWNIDGTTLFPDIPRERDFYPDPRLPLDQQTTEAVYADNDLDRGHLARRADLLWGDYDDAVAANHDSFCFTNIAPQRDTFNQAARGGVWGELENAVLALDGLTDRRLSVFGGPVLADGDPSYRDLVLLPRSFWKIVVYRVEEQLRYRAFLLTQDLDDLGFLGEYATYQVGLADLADRTGVDFSGLADLVEDSGTLVDGGAPRLIDTLADLRL